MLRWFVDCILTDDRSVLCSDNKRLAAAVMDVLDTLFLRSCCPDESGVAQRQKTVGPYIPRLLLYHTVDSALPLPNCWH